MVEKVVRELLEVKGIEKPYAHFGGSDYSAIMSVATHNGVETKISTLRKVAKLLDVPAKFLARMFQLRRIDEDDKT